MTQRSRPTGDTNGRIQAPELLHALRGIWKLGGQELVLDIDQETGELLACTYEGEHVDPRPVITKGIQVRPFERTTIGT
ncbi:MAG: hypothetical protein HKO65_19100 [Gemmatimonadetes bacterium]|nr:hypothetical protein [Gemmatimonadota bacterium]NNM07208.1 hypothetical protein [Gemmatimonadota bacterium]